MWFWFQKYRSSCSQIYFRTGVLKFCNVHRKIPVLGFLFNKYLDFKACSFIKKRLQRRCFPVKFAKILSTPFFAEHIRSLLLEISYELSLYYIWERSMVSFYQCLFHFIACVSFLSISHFFSYLFVDSTTFWF